MRRENDMDGLLDDEQELYHPSTDPLRSPSWRHDRVRELLEGLSSGRERLAFSDMDDEPTRLAARVLRQYHEISGEGPALYRQRRRKLSRYNSLIQTWEVRSGITAGGDPDHLQVVFEASVLAGLSPEQIAEHCGVKPQVIRWYEQLFYDVRDRLSRKHWVCMRLIGPINGHGVTDMTLEKLCKYFAYHGGPYALAAILSAYDDTIERPAQGRPLREFYTSVYELGLHRRSAAAIGDIWLNSRGHLDLFELVTNMINHTRQMEGASGPLSEYHTNMLAFIQNVPLYTGKQGLKEMQRDLPVQGAREPRVWQQVQAQDPASKAQTLEELERPLDRKLSREGSHAKKTDDGD